MQRMRWWPSGSIPLLVAVVAEARVDAVVDRVRHLPIGRGAGIGDAPLVLRDVVGVGLAEAAQLVCGALPGLRHAGEAVPVVAQVLGRQLLAELDPVGVGATAPQVAL